MKNFSISNQKMDNELVTQIYKSYNLMSESSALKNDLSRILEQSIPSNDEYTIHEIYNYLIKNYYLGEINIKSAFYKKIMWKKDQITMFEIPLGKSRADIFAINGESIIYEIKTEIDNFDRLEEQINNYHKYAEKVYVICNRSSYKKITKHITNGTGIILYTKNKDKITFQYKKAAKKCQMFNEIFQLNQIALTYLKKIIKIKLETKTDYIDYCIQNLSSIQINLIFKDYLREKYKNQCNFILRNHEIINDIDIQTFFKLNVSPNKIYKKDKS